MACLFGHKWNGCKCEKCGKLRDSDHRFRPGANPCEEKCEICGQVRESHNYVNGFCNKCGRQSETPVALGYLSENEILELSYCIDGFNYYNGQEQASILGKALSALGVFKDLEKNPDLIKVGNAAKDNLRRGALSAEQAALVRLVIGKAKAGFEGPLFETQRGPEIQKRIDNLVSAGEKLEKGLAAFQEESRKYS